MNKSFIKKILKRSTIIQKFFSGIATILTLHRVEKINSNRLPANENMKVSPEFLEAFIINSKKQGYNFISLDDLYEQLIKREVKTRPQLLITFDDGYADNFKHAYPVLKKHNIPFTIYVTTSFPDNSSILWWFVLEDLILENNNIIVNDNQIFKCDTFKSKNRAFISLRNMILALPQQELQKKLSEIFCHYDIDWHEPSKKYCMSWDQIINLSKDDNVTIAGHTQNHLALKGLEHDLIIKEIVKGNQIIENRIKKKVMHFSYPFGSSNEINKNVCSIVKQLDLKTATTTMTGNIFFNHRKYLNILPRFMLTESFELSELSNVRKKRFVTI